MSKAGPKGPSKSTPRAVTRFFIRCGAHLPELVVMAAADTLGKEKKQSRQNTAFITFLVQLVLDFENDFRPRASRPKLITGHDLIVDFGLKPSPLFKKILDRVEEERLSKSEMTRQEAVHLVRKLIKKEDRGQMTDDRLTMQNTVICFLSSV